MEIEKWLKTDWIGQTICCLESVDSTNLQAKRMAEEGALEGTLVVANEQTAGRGRRGRSWVSPPGTNLYFTILLRPRLAPDKAAMLTLVMAMAVAKGIRRILQTPDGRQPLTTDDGKTGVGIKWPNDVVIDGRKVCGILTELNLSTGQNCIDSLLIGTGINVALQDFPEELKGHAIALEELAGRKLERGELLNAVLTAFEGYYGDFLLTRDLTGIKEEYDALLVNMGRMVRVLDPKGEYEGIARGIQNTGELIVELPDGERRIVYAGEVSVRGIYGYA